MDDPRFKHVASDPRFKSIPKKSRKVTIDSRFQPMFSGDRFRVEYKVDKRGRKVNQSSGEDLRKYYELEEEETEKKKKNSDHSAEEEEEESDAESADWSGEGSLSSDEDGLSDGDVSGLHFTGIGGVQALEESWGEGLGAVPVDDHTSHRIAVCNMDWDHIEAQGIYVLLNSFKPAGSSIVSVTVYPSDFGLERLSREEIEGPVALLDEDGKSHDRSEDAGEGGEYSREKLRQYQLSRFKYYYAVVECDCRETAEHIYQQCNGLEYEHSGGQLDLRFIPDDMTFEDRQPKSTVREDIVPADFTPTDFVSSALQQSKVKLTWDETDPHRVQVTQKKFTKDDLQSMNFSAYLASSSDDEEEEEEETGAGEDKRLRYKMLLEGEDTPDPANEEMEITWEPGLKEAAEKVVKKKKEDSGSSTPWEQYLQEKKRKRKEGRRKTEKETQEKQPGEGKAADNGFDDPFFHHSVTTATAATTKHKKGKRKREADEEELKQRNELELLMMSDGEEGGEEKDHFSFSSIMNSEKEAGKKRKKPRKKAEESHVDNFQLDVSDPRFRALYDSHEYAPDPSAPQYRASKGMADIMQEKRRRNKSKAKQPAAIADKLGDPSLNSLIQSVKSKCRSRKGKTVSAKVPLNSA